jgi:riboflavin transporter 2
MEEALIYFFIAQRYSVPDTVAVYFLVGLGAVISFMLAFMYDMTTTIGGSEHSTGLLVLAFIGGSIDCATSIVYWPFVAQYKAVYSSALAAGEGKNNSKNMLMSQGYLVHP